MTDQTQAVRHEASRAGIYDLREPTPEERLLLLRVDSIHRSQPNQGTAPLESLPEAGHILVGRVQDRGDDEGRELWLAAHPYNIPAHGFVAVVPHEIAGPERHSLRRDWTAAVHRFA